MFSEHLYDIKDIRRLFSVRGFISSFDAVRERDFYFAGEMHDFWEAVYVSDGKITATADERVYVLEKGQLLFHKPMEFHRLRGGGGSDSHIYVFSFDASGDGMNFFNEKLFLLDKAAGTAIIEICAKIRAALQSAGNDGYALSSHSAAAALEGFLLELYSSGKSALSPKPSEPEENYKKIVKILNENTEKDLSVGQIAKMCNMSVSSLKKNFALYSDRGVRKYFMYIKMRKAIGLLYQGVSVPEISDALSFSGVNYFYSVFKRETGYTPKEYMKRYK